MGKPAFFRLILLRAGDVHPNPGPARYPCGTCDRPVTRRHWSIQCRTCLLWHHQRCTPLTVQDLRRGISAWTCSACPPQQHSGVSSQPPTSPPPPSTTPTQHTPSHANTQPSTHGSNTTFQLPPHLSTSTTPQTAPTHNTNSRNTNQATAPTIQAKDLSFLQWNANGLSTQAKQLELDRYISTHPYDVICLQETGFFQPPSNSFVFKHYAIITKPRTTGRTPNTLIGGGVTTLIHKRLTYTHNTVNYLHPNDNTTETISTDIHTKHKTYTVINIYIPPIRQTTQDIRTQSFDPSLLPSSSNTLIFGDFNAHHWTWDNFMPADSLGSQIFDWIESVPLTSLNDPDRPTHLQLSTGSQSSPDLTIVHANLETHCSWSTLPALPSDHLPISVILQSANNQSPKPFKSNFVYKKADWKLFQKHLDDALQSFDITTHTVDTAEKHLRTCLLQAARKAIPRGRRKKFKPWWTPEVEAAVQARKTAYTQAHIDEEHRQAYLSASRNCSTVIRQAKREAWKSFTSNLSFRTDQANTWRVLRSHLGTPSPISNASLQLGTKVATTDREKAGLFAQHYYASARFKLDKQHRHLRKAVHRQCNTTPPQTSGSCSPFTMKELFFAIKKLRTNKAAGPDDITNEMLTHLPTKTLESLLQLYNLSWETGKCPDIWRKAHIVPILKKGKSPSQLSSYRPISLTSCLCKLMERLVQTRLSYILESNDLLSSVQAGFRPLRSTVDQTVRLTQSIANGFNHKKPASRTVLATIDFSRAFDTVRHDALLHKLSILGLPLPFIRWIKAFLSDRRAAVSFNGELSKFFRLKAGVPQGSVLSPTLFIIFINDIVAALPKTVQASLFADDLAVWSSNPNVATAQKNVQKALDHISDWSAEWNLFLNVDKSNCSFFSTDPHQANLQPNLTLTSRPLPFCRNPTFLGITYDRTLSFHQHTKNVTAKTMPKITALKSLASPHWGASSSCLRTIYQTLVRPTLDYGAPAWFPSLAPSNLRPLSSIHHAACRAISGCLRSSPIDFLCSEARLTPLDTHLKIQCGKYFEKALRLPDNNPVKHTLQNTAPHRLKTQKSLQILARPISQSAGLADTPRVPLHPCSAVPPWSVPLPLFRPALSNPCSRTDPPDVRLRAAVATLSSLPSPDVELWTDGSVGPSGGGSGCLAICHLCDSSTPLTVPSGSHSSSFQAELIAIREALTWLRLHSQSCQPSCVHLCSDSLSCVTRLESGPEASRCSQLQDVWRLLSELSHIPTFIFQWVPSHCGLPHNETADSLASRAATLPQTGIPLPFSTACARITRLLSCQWRSSITSSLLTGPPPRLPDPPALPRSVCSTLAQLRCNGHSPVLRSYLHRIGQSPSPSCLDCGNPDDNVHHLLLFCPTLDPQRLRFLGPVPTLSLLWEDPLAVGRFLLAGGRLPHSGRPPDLPIATGAGR